MRQSVFVKFLCRDQVLILIMYKIILLLIIGVPVFYCTETLEKLDEPEVTSNNDSKSAPLRLSKPSGYSLKGKQVITRVNIPESYPNNGRSPGYGGTNSNDNPYIITKKRLDDIRSGKMYEYDSDDYQKDVHNSSPQIHKNFNFQLPFFGFRYNYTRISINGYLEFSDPPEHFTYPLTFPNPDWPAKNDPAFIGIFFSKCRIGSKRQTDIDPRDPGLYFRMERDLHSRNDSRGVEMRERLMWDIREGVIGSETFLPKHAVVVTWKNVSFAGGIDNALYKTNTFQLVLATDEVFAYAIFNYLEIQWTSHTEAGGDTTGGEGGVPAFVGFNAGNGTRSFSYAPYSQASTLRDLVGRGWANNIPGRHIFRIDENILLGTCNKDIAGANLPLSFAPESGNMLGGTIVNITGPCFTPDMKIKCMFNDKIVTGQYVGINRAVCVQPFLLAEGYVLFDVAIGDGKYNWKGKYFIETPATATEKIAFLDDSVHEKYPQQIKISWVANNLTSNSLSSSVQISLWGYRERTISPELVYIDLIESSVPNSGSYTINPASCCKNRNNYLQNDLTFGFLQINLTNPNTQTVAISPVIWSRPIPLGWYFSYQWERLYGKKWPDTLCDNWLKNDRFLKNFASEIAQCPCTLEQALADKGRFMPDFDCDIDANPDCFYHKGARHCVKTGAPSQEGSEQQCCYDKNNYLMMSYDQQWGSTPKRSSNFGVLPWNEANKVPSLSQWYHDIAPFHLCCLWQEEQAVGCETFRFERRPSQDCVAYQAPYVATIFGDPHIITFDDLEYTFNGKGEFVLVHTNTERQKLDIQARFEQVSPNIYGEVHATQMTAIVGKDNTSATIEIRLRPRYAQWRYRMDVIADGKRVYFDRPSLRVQHFSGVTVYQPSYVLNQSEIIIMFQSGAGIEVVENMGFMSARVYLPWTYLNTTRGLFGNWTFDKIDDFTLPDGTILQIPNSNSLDDFSSIHKNFAIRWLLGDAVEVSKGGSLFVHEYLKTASYYANATFEPIYSKMPEAIINELNYRNNISVTRENDIAMAKYLCGDSYQCKYDYTNSLNRDMAFCTLDSYKRFTAIKDLNKRRVLSCGVLETPRFGRKSNFFFVPGTKVVFECNQDFILIGDPRRTCSANGRWDVPEYGYTECLREEEYSLQAIGKTWGIIAAVILPIAVVLICVGYKLLQKYRGDAERKPKDSDGEDDDKIDLKPTDNKKSMKLSELNDSDNETTSLTE